MGLETSHDADAVEDRAGIETIAASGMNCLPQYWPNRDDAVAGRGDLFSIRVNRNRRDMVGIAAQISATTNEVVSSPSRINGTSLQSRGSIQDFG